MAEANNYKDAGEQPPSTVEHQAPQVAEENAPSTSSEQATEIPSANAPEPAEQKSEQKSEDDSAKPAAKAPEAKDDKSEKSTPAKPAAKEPKPAAEKTEESEDKPAKPAAKKGAASAKKEKPPAVEDKPFAEFMQQHYLPALEKAFAAQGIKGIDLTFKKQKFPIVGYEQDECWQVIGDWQQDSRQFNLYFPEEDISGSKFFSCNEGSRPSTLEHFLGDERRISLDLMVYGVMQRLNGQKWLSRN